MATMHRVYAELTEAQFALLAYLAAREVRAPGSYTRKLLVTHMQERLAIDADLVRFGNEWVEAHPAGGGAEWLAQCYLLF
jgi:hypothetical protein